MNPTENLGIMAQLRSSETGDQIYNAFLKKHNLKRSGYPGDNYHVTLGFVENVDTSDVIPFKNHIREKIEGLLKGLNFKFGTCSTLASEHPFLVAFPNQETHKVLCKINRILLKAIEEFNTLYNKDYGVNTLTHPEIFVPHISLNGRYGVEIPISSISHVIKSINTDMENMEIPIDELVID